jgi:uncharacterized protein
MHTTISKHGLLDSPTSRWSYVGQAMDILISIGLVYFYTLMEFEYDPAKSETNKKKHGIDFEEAQDLWFDPDSKGFVAKSDDEDRFAIVATFKKEAMGWFLHPRRE